MNYLDLIQVLIGCAVGCLIFFGAYKLGIRRGRAQSLNEIRILMDRNDKLWRAVNFVEAESEHLQEVLRNRVAVAHIPTTVLGFDE